MKLSRWQRSWIVLSVIWLIPVALLTVWVMWDATRFESGFEGARYERTRDLIKEEASQRVKLADGTMILNVPKRISKEGLEKLYVGSLGPPPKNAKEAESHRLTYELLQSSGDTEEGELDFDALIQPSPKTRVWRLTRAVGPAAQAAESQRLQEAYGKWIDFSAIESEHKDNRRKLRWINAMIGISGFLFWLVSIGFLYLLGTAVGWVIKGFKGARR